MWRAPPPRRPEACRMMSCLAPRALVTPTRCACPRNSCLHPLRETLHTSSARQFTKAWRSSRSRKAVLRRLAVDSGWRRVQPLEQNPRQRLRTGRCGKCLQRTRYGRVVSNCDRSMVLEGRRRTVFPRRRLHRWSDDRDRRLRQSGGATRGSRARFSRGAAWCRGHWAQTFGTAITAQPEKRA
jgi:hypothetical protein